MAELDLQPVPIKNKYGEVPKNILVDPDSPEAMLRPDELEDVSLAEMDESQPNQKLDLQPLDLQPVSGVYVNKEAPLDLQELDIQPVEPSWLDEVKTDWSKAKEEDSGLGILPAFLRERLERGVKNIGSGIREYQDLNLKVADLKAKQRRGIATPEELQSLDELDKKLQEESVNIALNFGPLPIVASGRVGRIKDLFKELWEQDKLDVPRSVLKKAETLLDEY